MNEYLIPIFELNKDVPYIKKISARSYNDCEEKLTNWLVDKYDITDDYDSFDILRESVADKVRIGEIKDLDEY